MTGAAGRATKDGYYLTTAIFYPSASPALHSLFEAVGADALARYQRLHTSHPPAVVAIHAGACGGCGVAVPTAMQQKVAAGEILQCLSCNRLLVEG